VSLEQVRYFVAVAEAGSITAAARTLRISQPPLSRAIRALESELGRELFDREAQGVRLRPEGERFLLHASQILEAVERAVSSVGSLPSQESRGS
jgi:LysR family hydrogen peroxide-inducible transcriptional activator